MFPRQIVQFALIAFTAAVLVAFGLTGDWRSAAAAGGLQLILLRIGFALHERVPPGLAALARVKAPTASTALAA